MRIICKRVEDSIHDRSPNMDTVDSEFHYSLQELHLHGKYEFK